MPTYKIRGIDVDFPFKAYECQIVYMDKVIESLQNKSNALLESPTGTGKTLCLLCASLAWRKSLGDFNTDASLGPSQSQSDGRRLPPIVYTSRTHSQLQQVIRELKRTNYRPRMVVLGSREQLCIHDDVRVLHGRAQTNACHFVCKKRICTHHSRISEFVKNNPQLGCDPIDIEDLIKIGRSQGPCPYYLSRELHKSVDILFTPYNYLIDRGNRTSLTLEWRDSVLIFDEAHNLEGICADAASFDLPSSLLTACISEAHKCVDLAVQKRTIENSNENSQSPESFAVLKGLLVSLEDLIAKVPIESKELGFTRPGPYMYELLAQLNITNETANMLMDTIDNAVMLLEDAENASASGSNKSKGNVCRLENMGDILRIIFKDGGKSHAISYRVHVQEVEAKAFDAFKGKTSRTLSWWCFNPGIALEEFSRMGVGSIILTSGTLSPLDSFAQELKLDFPVRLENPHVIASNQIWAGVVSTGPSSCSFNSSYRNRDSLSYKQELGNAIANFARIVPDGLLVFFPSYYLLDHCIGCWKDMGHTSSTNADTIWERICKHKQPVIEPRQSSLFSSSIEDFMSKLKDKSTSGAIFFAVCRGKVSEGLDFADHAGRAVVVTGMPFATRTDPKVRLKREYLDQQALSHKKDYKVLTGEEWYSQQASRAVNQAVGRVIRHRHDYGAILFCDERFAQSGRQSQMSRWLQPHIKHYSKFGEVVFTLTRFFRDIATSDLPKLKTDTMSIDNSDDKKGVIPGDKLLLAKDTTHSVIENSTDEDGSGKSLSSMIRARSNNHSQFREALPPPIRASCSQLCNILPANCSTLTPFKNQHALTSKHPKDLSFNEKKSWNLDWKTRDLQNQYTGVLDLTKNSEWDGQLRETELIVPCCSKKPKLLKIDPDNKLHSEKPSCELFDASRNEHISSQCLNSDLDKQQKLLRAFLCRPATSSIQKSGRSTQNAQIRPAVVLKNDVSAEETALEVPAPKDVHSGNCDAETRGSAYLSQVKEKLSPAEYRKFVDYMKALKSESMQISDVLKSIARLFSTSDRLPLRKRFKDYVPPKYRPMYEKHITADDTVLRS